MKKPPPGTQSIVRAVRLLKAIAVSDGAVALGELAEELKISKPTVHRILSALEYEGLVIREGGGFRPGSAVVTMGAQALAGSNLRAIARRHLEQLASESGETATLEIPSGDCMLILDEVRGGQVVGANIEVGTRWPMYATSTGKAYLGALSDEDLTLHLRGSRRRFTPSTITASSALKDEVRASAGRGFAVSEEELEAGYSAVASVARGVGAQPVAALSIGGPSERLSRDRLAALGVRVSGAAGSLSKALGGA